MRPTTRPGSMNWVEIGGMIVVPQYGWVSPAACATAPTTSINHQHRHRVGRNPGLIPTPDGCVAAAGVAGILA